MSRHRGAKPPRRYELLGEISLLSPEYLYPLSDGPSMRCHRITKPHFRACSTCMSRSQAPYAFTLYTIANRAEGTFGSLRYSLGGDRPSQTTHHTLFRFKLDFTCSKGGISRVAPNAWRRLFTASRLSYTCYS